MIPLLVDGKPFAVGHYANGFCWGTARRVVDFEPGRPQAFNVSTIFNAFASLQKQFERQAAQFPRILADGRHGGRDGKPGVGVVEAKDRHLFRDAKLQFMGFVYGPGGGERIDDKDGGGRVGEAQHFSHELGTIEPVGRDTELELFIIKPVFFQGLAKGFQAIGMVAVIVLFAANAMRRCPSEIKCSMPSMLAVRDSLYAKSESWMFEAVP